MSTSAIPASQPAFVVPGLRRRFLCMIYESMLLFGVVFFAGWFFGTLLQQRHALALRPELMGWLFFVIGAYFVWFWTHGGQTLAMKTWRIRLIRTDGHKVDVVRAVLRYLLCWVFLLAGLALIRLLGLHWWGLLAGLAVYLMPTIWARFDRDGQYLHDRLIGTRLVNTTLSERKSPSSE